jgi:hypothetical protein
MEGYVKTYSLYSDVWDNDRECAIEFTSHNILLVVTFILLFDTRIRPSSINVSMPGDKCIEPAGGTW